MRGGVLSKHYRKAFDYWTRLVPGRPRYVVLCNFDRFHVYDFETQMDSPVGIAKLDTLAANHGPLAFLLPDQPKPVFDNEHVAVTLEAAGKLAKCLNKLINRGIERPLAQRIILQTHIALFAEDIPRIGLKTACWICAELPRHLPNSRIAAAWCGLTQRLHQSGSSVRDASTIGREGNRFLRKILSTPALAARRANPRLKAFTDSLEARGKSKMSALLAVEH